MKAQILYFLKIALITGLPFGIMMGIDFFDFDSFDYFKFLFSALFFGIMMGSLALSVQVSALKSLGVSDITFEDLGVIHNKKVFSNKSLDEILTLLKTKYHNYRINTDSSMIKLYKKPTLFSIGEVITVCLDAADVDKKVYSIESRPYIKFAHMDDGVNYRNVLDVGNAIAST